VLRSVAGLANGLGNLTIAAAAGTYAGANGAGSGLWRRVRGNPDDGRTVAGEQSKSSQPHCSQREPEVA